MDWQDNASLEQRSFIAQVLVSWGLIGGGACSGGLKIVVLIGSVNETCGHGGGVSAAREGTKHRIGINGEKQSKSKIRDREREHDR